MSRYLTRQQSRTIDARALNEFQMPGLLLMENAARGCVDTLVRLGVRGPIGICCGKGNNGGDGFAMARRLDLLGYSVKVLLWCEPDRLRGDAAVNFQILSKTDVPIIACERQDSAEWLEAHFQGVEWIVDALLGTGSEGAPRPPISTVLSMLNRLPAKRFAVDLPSGMDCDTGIPSDPTFRADHTCTFVAEKVGFRNPLAAPYLGSIHVVDIGAPRKLIESACG